MPGAARALGVAVKSVAKWRRQFAAGRLAGLEDAAPVGRRKAQLVLGEAERARLVRWSRRATTAQYLALRAKIVLRCAGGGTNRQAADLGVDESAVGRWRARFIARRLDGLADEPRPGRPPPILLGQVEDVIAATLGETPGNDTHWPRAPMAARTGLGKSAIGRIWKSPASSRTCRTRSRCPPVRCSWTRPPASGAWITTRPGARWCCAPMRKARSRRWAGPSRYCR